MSGPATYDLTIYQGDTFRLPLRLRTQNPDGTFGDYIDLTGSTVKAQVRATTFATDVLAEFTAELLDQTVVDTKGSVLLSLDPTTTAGLLTNGAPGVWDVQITFADGSVKTYLRGSVTVVPQVTR